MVALSLVLGGTAVAATTTLGDKKADTKLIKHLAPSLSVKNSAELGGLAAAKYQQKVQWALVKGDGSAILTQSGGISIAYHFTGGYYLHFPTSVAGHGISLTLAFGPDGSGYPPYQIEGAPCGGSGPDATTCIYSGTNTPNDLFVTVNNDSGTHVDEPFYAVVYP